jgi:hypothetical protein
VSGSSAQALIDAACFVDELSRAEAAATSSPAATITIKAAVAQRTFFTLFLLRWLDPVVRSYHTHPLPHK